jgi:hypothetical protein
VISNCASTQREGQHWHSDTAGQSTGRIGLPRPRRRGTQWQKSFGGQHVRIAQYALARRVVGNVVVVDTKGKRRQPLPLLLLCFVVQSSQSFHSSNTLSRNLSQTASNSASSRDHIFFYQGKKLCGYSCSYAQPHTPLPLMFALFVWSALIWRSATCLNNAPSLCVWVAPHPTSRPRQPRAPLTSTSSSATNGSSFSRILRTILQSAQLSLVLSQSLSPSSPSAAQSSLVCPPTRSTRTKDGSRTSKSSPAANSHFPSSATRRGRSRSRTT